MAELADEGRPGHLQPAVVAMQIVMEGLVAFHCPEVRQDLLPRPQLASGDRAPRIVVRDPAAHVGLGVDAAAAAQDLRLRDQQLAAAELRLRHCLMIGDVFGAGEKLHESGRNVQQHAGVDRSRLQQQDRGLELGTSRAAATHPALPPPMMMYS